MPIKSSSLGGTPFGDSNNRPSNPSIGQTYHNGSSGILEIYTGPTTGWLPESAPPGTPSVTSVVDTSSSNSYSSNTAGILTVTLTPSSNGGFVSTYGAYTTSGGFSQTSSTTTLTFTGLTLGTEYTIYSNALNTFGTSSNSANAAAIAPSTKPQTPTIGTATVNSQTGDVSVTWTLGNNGGKSLTGITVIPYLNGTTAQSATTVSGSATSANISGLAAASSYTFKVKATNINGDSPESSATNSITVPSIFDFIVVAGGGGGGAGSNSANEAGGGGAGGYRSSVGGESSGRGSSAESKLSIALNTNYSVTVGAGGPSTTTGGNSVFSSITSNGGGYGGSYSSGGSGGCGGGGSHNQQAGGSGTIGQGYNGGTPGSGSSAGGGGGAGANGANGVLSSIAATGGIGVQTNISGTPTYYAGGGGGGNPSTVNTGGLGGGGTGGSGPTSGTANTGGGGGGALAGSGTPGGVGGSGIVILKYPNAYTISLSAGLTGSTTNVGSNKVTRITAGTGTVSWS